MSDSTSASSQLRATNPSTTDRHLRLRHARPTANMADDQSRYWPPLDRFFAHSGAEPRARTCRTRTDRRCRQHERYACPSSAHQGHGVGAGIGRDGRM